MLGRVTSEPCHITQMGWGDAGMGMGSGFAPLAGTRASPCSQKGFLGTVVAQPSAMPSLHPRSAQLQLGSCLLLSPCSRGAEEWESCILQFEGHWQLRREPGLSLLGMRGLLRRAGQGEPVAGGQDSHANYCSSSRLKNRALLRLGFFLPL